MNYQSMVKKGIVIRGNNDVHYLGGKQKEFWRIISDLKTEIGKLKAIRARYFWDNDQSLIACSHQ